MAVGFVDFGSFVRILERFEKELKREGDLKCVE
jgi:hypothetical protein